MGLVNAFVNQIGRELAKDAYKKVTTGSQKAVTSIRRRTEAHISNNSLRYEISTFKVSPYDKVTRRNFDVLLEKTINELDPKDSVFIDVYSDLLELSKKIIEVLKDGPYKIDEAEIASNLGIQMKEDVSKHIAHIEELIEYQKDLIENNTIIYEDIKSKNPLIKFFMTAIGLNALYCDYGTRKGMIVYSIIWVALACIFYKIWSDTKNPAVIALSIIAYSMPFIASLIFRPKAKDFKKKIDESNSLITNLIKRKESLLALYK